MTTWTTSSRCLHNECVQVAWHRSTRCDSGSCVEATYHDSHILVRDSKLGDDSPLLAYTPRQWQTVLDAAREAAGPDDFAELCRDIIRLGNGDYCWDPPGTVWRDRPGCLHFTADEIDAFIAGVKAGDFDPDRLEAKEVARG